MFPKRNYRASPASKCYSIDSETLYIFPHPGRHPLSDIHERQKSFISDASGAKKGEKGILTVASILPLAFCTHKNIPGKTAQPVSEWMKCSMGLVHVLRPGAPKLISGHGSIIPLVGPKNVPGHR